jgi:hypothetical protein
MLDSQPMTESAMNAEDETQTNQLQVLSSAFRDQLIACLEEATRGRNGLFSDVDLLAENGAEAGWPEAARLRELAMALQNVFSQQEEQNPLIDEFLDLCSMHGESHPGERRLAQAFLKRIEKDEVGRNQNAEQPRRGTTPW